MVPASTQPRVRRAVRPRQLDHTVRLDLVKRRSVQPAPTTTARGNLLARNVRRTRIKVFSDRRRVTSAKLGIALHLGALRATRSVRLPRRRDDYVSSWIGIDSLFFLFFFAPFRREFGFFFVSVLC